jgi:DNA-binding NarL/FixJ family response regulator
MPTLQLMANVESFVVLEDHPLYRQGLVNYLREAFPSAEIKYQGDDFLAVRDVIAKDKPALAVVDLHLGDGRSPGEIVALFSSRKIPVLVISAINNFESVKSAFSMGATGFVSKDSEPEELGRAIKAVIRGDQWISSAISNALTTQKGPSDQLSVQEKKALILYASGLKLDLVARRMDVAPSTVKQYIERAKAKYQAAGKDIRTKTQMYKVLRDEGIIN